jgi:phosphoethanolamine N-methyltransferase
MAAAGFTDAAIESRNAWYRVRAREEIAALRGPLYARAAEALGHHFVDHNIEIWERMMVVLDTGEHCPTHLKARKPG